MQQSFEISSLLCRPILPDKLQRKSGPPSPALSIYSLHNHFHSRRLFYFSAWAAWESLKSDWLFTGKGSASYMMTPGGHQVTGCDRNKWTHPRICLQRRRGRNLSARLICADINTDRTSQERGRFQHTHVNNYAPLHADAILWIS